MMFQGNMEVSWISPCFPLCNPTCLISYIDLMVVRCNRPPDDSKSASRASSAPAVVGLVSSYSGPNMNTIWL